MSNCVEMNVVFEKHFIAMMKEYGGELLDAAGAKYGFDAEEAKTTLISDNVRFVSSSRKKDGVKTEVVAKKKNVPIPSKPRTIVPFCGTRSADCCQGIRMNHQLFTQCTNTCVGGDFCSTCQKQVDKSSNGKPTYGTVEDRMSVPAMEYVAGGKKVVLYSRVMDKLNITREQAIAAATEQGITISDEQFLVETVKKGRPSKDTSVSDTESENSNSSDKNKVGRPKKTAKVVTTTTGDDMIQEALDAVATKSIAETTKSSAETKSSDETKSAPTKSEITKAKIGDLKEMCAAAGLKEDKKTAMQKSLRSHYGHESEDDMKKSAPKPVPEPEPELEYEVVSENDTTSEPDADAWQDPGKEEEKEEEKKEEEDEDDEDAIEAVYWDAPNGTTYMKTEDGTLYDVLTHTIMGEWDDEKNEVRPPDDEDDEEDDEE